MVFIWFQEALRSRGLKDDTTCVVVDIIPYGYPAIPATPKKKQNLLTSLIPVKRFHNSVNKGTNKLSAVGTVEELFEEGSAMLAERYVRDQLVHWLLTFNSPLLSSVGASFLL